MTDLEGVMLSYRANPSSAGFEPIYRELAPKMERCARWTGYGASSADVSDAVSMTMIRAEREIRKFMFQCPRCGGRFLSAKNLMDHGEAEHKLRGLIPKRTVEQVVDGMIFLYMRKLLWAKDKEIAVPFDEHEVIKMYGTYGVVNLVTTADHVEMAAEIMLAADRLGVTASKLIEDSEVEDDDHERAVPVVEQLRRKRWESRQTSRCAI